MDNFYSTPTPLVFVAETWVVTVVSIVIVGCFIFLIVLLVIGTRVKSASPSLYTNVRRRIFYAQPSKSVTTSNVTETKASTEPLMPLMLNAVVPYQPIMALPPPPPPPPPRPFFFRRPRKIFVPTPVPVPVPAPMAYYPGRMFANKIPRRFSPYSAAL